MQAMQAEPGDFVVGDDPKGKIFGILLGLVHVHGLRGAVVSDEADILPLQRGPLIEVRRVPSWTFHERDPDKSGPLLLQMGLLQASDGSYRPINYREPRAMRVSIAEPMRPVIPGLPKIADIFRRAPQG